MDTQTMIMNTTLTPAARNMKDLLAKVARVSVLEPFETAEPVDQRLVNRQELAPGGWVKGLPTRSFLRKCLDRLMFGSIK